MNKPATLLITLGILVVAIFSTQPLSANILDLQLSFSPEEESMLGGHAGVVFLEDEFWTSRWTDSLLFRFDATGVLIESFVIEGVREVRAMTWDGTSIYAANNSDTIHIIDPVAKVETGIIVVSQTARYCTYDPTSNGLWIGNWNTSLDLVTLDGVTINSIPAYAHDVQDMYSVVFDGETEGGPYLWTFTQGGISSAAEIERIHIGTGERSQINFDVIASLGVEADDLAGGLFISSNLVDGKRVIGGIVQGNPDVVFAYELGGLPAVDAGVISVAMLDAHTQVPVNHWSAANGFQGSIRNQGTETLDSIFVFLEIYKEGILTHIEGDIVTDLAPFGQAALTFSSFIPTETGSYTAEFYSQVSGSQIDETTFNDRTMTSFEITDFTFARDDGEYLGTSYLVSNETWGYAVTRYELVEEDTLESIFINLNNPIQGDTTYAIVVSDVGNFPGFVLVEGDVQIIDEGIQSYELTFSEEVILPPNVYYFGVYEAADTGINLSHSNNIYTPLTNYFFTGGGTWSVSNIETARAIRPNFGKIIIPDTEAPIISLIGSPTIVHPCGNLYQDPGAMAFDEIDGELTAQIQVSGIVDGCTAGSYPVTFTVTDAAGNTTTVERLVLVTESCGDPCPVDVGGVVGIHEPAFAQQVRLFPNPSKGLIFMDLGALPYQKIGVEVINVTGQVMYQSADIVSTARRPIIDLSSQEAGMYWLVFKTEMGVFSRAVVLVD